MPKTKRKSRLKFGEQTHWHPYVLQSLTPDKFTRIVNKILKGEYILLNFTPDDEDSHKSLKNDKD